MIIREAPDMVCIDGGDALSNKMVMLISRVRYNHDFKKWFADNDADMYLRIIRVNDKITTAEVF